MPTRPPLSSADSNIPADGFGPTPSQTVGPYFHQGLMLPDDPRALSNRLFPSETAGRIELRGQVLDHDGTPVPDALIEIWQADARGRYGDPAGFGRSDTRHSGQDFVFQTVKPGRAAPELAPQVHLWLGLRGLLTHLVTRLYFPDEDNSADPVLASVPARRRGTLVAGRLDTGAGRVYRLDLRLGGPHETVYFGDGPDPA